VCRPLRYFLGLMSRSEVSVLVSTIVEIKRALLAIGSPYNNLSATVCRVKEPEKCGFIGECMCADVPNFDINFAKLKQKPLSHDM
jgi:hypothetical protein